MPPWAGGAGAAALQQCLASQTPPPFHSLPPALAEFDLEGLRSRLDEQGLAVATAQEGSVRSRKTLAERTKGKPRDLARGSSLCIRMPPVLNQQGGRRTVPLPIDRPLSS